MYIYIITESTQQHRMKDFRAAFQIFPFFFRWSRFKTALYRQKGRNTFSLSCIHNEYYAAATTVFYRLCVIPYHFDFLSFPYVIVL